jgi:hypothetical protein
MTGILIIFLGKMPITGTRWRKVFLSPGLGGVRPIVHASGFLFHGDPGLKNVLFRRVPRKKNINAGISIAVSDFGTALIDNFVLSKEERKYYKKCKESKIPNDAWSVWSDIADAFPSHKGLEELVMEGMLFRRGTYRTV